MKKTSLLITLLTLLYLPLTQANWLTMGVLDEQGKPAGCFVISENPQSTIQLLYNSKMKLGKIKFKSKIKKGNQKVPFTSLKVEGNTIIFSKADKNTPKKIVKLFKRGRTATLKAKNGQKVRVNLTGFSRALKNCQIMMKNKR